MSTESPETGKQRATRVPLDYFKHPGALEIWKVRLLALAMIGTAGWWAVGLIRSDQGNLRFSRGSVASVHAMWDHNCTACHEPFTPITAEKWPESIGWHVPAGSKRCTTCHAGPVHHGSQNEIVACASCHREHRGREASLVNLPDRDCTRCHMDLANHSQAPLRPDPGFANVTQFDADRKHHPEFRSIKADPGKLKFSHTRHLTSGLVQHSGDRGKWTLGDIRDRQERERYASVPWQASRDNGAPVQLDCASCHQLDSNDLRRQRPGGIVTDFPPARSAGASMLPVTYANHCQACHPLTYEGKQPAENVKEVTLPPDQPVPHHLQPPEVHEFLWRTYASLAARSDKAVLERVLSLRPDPQRPMPGKPVDAGVARVRDLIQNQVTAAEKILFLGNNTCGKCHHSKPSEGIVPERIVPTAIPQVWYKHARFNHAAHRAADCRQCHPQAQTSRRSEDVLVPDIDNCIQCHARPTRIGGIQRGGARFNCSECHRYHQGDQPLAGIGSRARGAKPNLSIQDFLSGGLTAP